jgi:hypothetical protein
VKRLKFVENSFKKNLIKSFYKMKKNIENSVESLRLNSNKEEFEVPVRVQKDQWGNEIEFLLSCITLSVGLGNVWRYRKANYNLF